MEKIKEIKISKIERQKFEEIRKDNPTADMIMGGGEHSKALKKLFKKKGINAIIDKRL